jgi:hypothetical protein
VWVAHGGDDQKKVLEISMLPSVKNVALAPSQGHQRHGHCPPCQTNSAATLPSGRQLARNLSPRCARNWRVSDPVITS